MTELEKLQERVRWLEQGLKVIEAAAVLDPVAPSYPTCFGSAYDIRNIARHYLKGKNELPEVG